MKPNDRLEEDLLRTARSMKRTAVADVRELVAAARETEAARELAAASAKNQGEQLASRRARTILDALLAAIDRDL